LSAIVERLFKALRQAGPGKFGVGEQAGRHLPPGCLAVTTQRVVEHHPKRIGEKNDNDDCMRST
jgi:hypothetical protein